MGLTLRQTKRIVNEDNKSYIINDFEVKGRYIIFYRLLRKYNSKYYGNKRYHRCLIKTITAEAILVLAKW
jgi:hypothetical protein